MCVVCGYNQPSYRCIRNDLYLLSLVSKIVEQISVRDELGDEAKWLLDSDAADQVDDVVVVTLGDLLHHFNLGEKVGALLPSGSIYGNKQRMHSNVILVC